MATKNTGMLVASKNGNISASTLIKETRHTWILEIEKREVRISKADPRQRAFDKMSDALAFAGADGELIEHFAQEEAAREAATQS